MSEAKAIYMSNKGRGEKDNVFKGYYAYGQRVPFKTIEVTNLVLMPRAEYEHRINELKARIADLEVQLSKARRHK